MKKLIATLTTLALLPAAQAGEMKHSENMPMDQQDRKMTPAQQERPVRIVASTGTVKKISPEKGTITLAHAPVPELKWPAMVMPFKATPEQMEAVAVGDEVTFEFTSGVGMNAELTSISKR